MKLKAKYHASRKPGQVRRFSDDSLKLVTKDGSLVNCVRKDGGALVKAPRLNKKQRVAARRLARLQASQS